jgi:hypothetical protein
MPDEKQQDHDGCRIVCDAPRTVSTGGVCEAEAVRLGKLCMHVLPNAGWYENDLEKYLD